MTTLQIINLLQRITGLTAFFLLTLQIFLSTDTKLTKIHKITGIITYLFVFIHPVLMIAFRYFLYHKLDPFYVFTDACVLCDGIYEYYINFGRIALYLITGAVLVVILNNWKKLHIVNYIAFYLVSIHAYLIGTDPSSKIFLTLFWGAQIAVLFIIAGKIRRLLLKNSS